MLPIIQSHNLAFAENRKIFEIGELHKDLNEFSNWAKENRLEFNPFKCQLWKYVLKIVLHCLLTSTEKLPYVNKAKVLGLSSQWDLKWACQVDSIIKKAKPKNVHAQIR